MYGINGEKELTEQILTHLDGYEGSKPVRVGNAAYIQNKMIYMVSLWR
jgi:alpha,alpha-trehalase